MEYGLFEYASAPHIFLNRTGVGPLHVAWDTNILIDYLQFGRALWNDEALDIENPQHAEQVDAIGQIIDPYFCFWDVRIHLFEEILDDAKRQLSIERRSDREHALERFARALMYADWSEDDEGEPEPVDVRGWSGQDPLFDTQAVPHILPSLHQRLIDALPDGHDRILVNEAVERGIHLFLTQDRGILKAAPLARTVGLVLTSPVGLLQLFEEAGISPLQFPMPDLARISKVIEALPSGPA
ncbi:hypothetical protein ABZY10_32130 [Streptomyces sp. NPDC006539]|uniref:hypothetical protein n=1 Tax=Streptomyces sp. NPDC006539 TaxID=3155352 RepID=UPI0033BC4A67